LDKTLQQRLIGAILLVALGVIFIPVLLDGSGYRSRQERIIEMPAEPEFPPLKEFRPKTKVSNLEMPSAPEAAVKAESHTPESSELKPPVKAFALQVSTVTIKNNAYALRDELRKKGYSAYVETRTRNGKISYRVRIGPELDMKRLEHMKKALLKEEGLDGFIVNHP
jgi:DedD protein